MSNENIVHWIQPIKLGCNNNINNNPNICPQPSQPQPQMTPQQPQTTRQPYTQQPQTTIQQPYTTQPLQTTTTQQTQQPSTRALNNITHTGEQYFMRQQSPMYSNYMNHYSNNNLEVPAVPILSQPHNPVANLSPTCKLVGECMPIEEAEKLTMWYNTLENWYDQMRQWHASVSAIATLENNRQPPQIIKIPTNKKCSPRSKKIKMIRPKPLPLTNPKPLPLTHPKPLPLTHPKPLPLTHPKPLTHLKPLTHPKPLHTIHPKPILGKTLPTIHPKPILGKTLPTIHPGKGHKRPAAAPMIVEHFTIDNNDSNNDKNNHIIWLVIILVILIGIVYCFKF